ncbi:IS630 family transposase [Sorangium sp. So ce1335]|uniref:IS630 family transposase n=1 Tax=Sorangium sp. So ce1335 TaxID=3133335 RepID=UPI003F6229D1
MLQQRARKARDGAYRIRCLVLLRLDAGATPARIAEELQVARSTISRIRSRFLAEGLAGLRDHRAHNGQRKVSAAHRRRLEQLLDASPQDFGWARPTWTRELLALQLERDTGLRLSVGHIGRLLRAMGARRKRPRPIVRCPWPKARERRRIGAIRKLICSLPRDEIAFYVDEMDVDLNPRLGLDWMRRGRQKRVLTPGNNQKRYVAGALTIGSGKLTWAFGARKSSDLFIAALATLLRRYRRYRRLHVIVDNFGIHTSKKTRAFVEAAGGKLVLHFLPPYAPQYNRIERVWKQVHDNVTRNHRCASIDQLVEEVDDCLEALSPYPGSSASLRPVVSSPVADSGSAI